MRGQSARLGKRQNFVVHVAESAAGGLVLQLPDVEFDGKQARLPAVTLLPATQSRQDAVKHAM